MVSAKRLAQMMTDECSLTPSSSLVAAKGHFVVYTVDGSRFEVPLPYLGTAVIIELLRMSEDEFGFTSDCRITLPCHVEVMEYVMHLLGRDAPEEVERAFLSSMVWACDHGNGLETSMGLRSVVVSSF